MKRLLINSIFLVVLYIYIHNPVPNFLGGIGSVKLLYLLAIPYFFTSSREFSRYLYEFKNVLIIFSIILLYVLLHTAMGGYTLYVRHYLVAFVELFIVPYFIVSYFSRFILFNEKNTVRYIVDLAVVGALISSACVFFPGINRFVYSNFEIAESEIKDVTDLFRGFGISEDLEGSYGMLQGIFMALLILNLKDYKKAVLILPFLLISVLLNARTGLIISLVGIIVVLFAQSNFKKLIRLGIVIAVVSLLIFNFYYLFNLNEDSISFVTRFFDEFVTMSENKSMDDTTAGILFGRMMIFPKDPFAWVFGTGVNLFLMPTGKNSDIGYIIQLNYGGLIYLFLLSSFVFGVAKYIKRSFSFELAVLLIVSLAISNFKGNIFPLSGFLRLLMLVYMISIQNKLNLKAQK